MPRFYMHICDGFGLTEDEEGVDLPDSNVARKKAVEAARDVMAGDIRKGFLDVTSFIEVEDESRTLLFTVTFADVIDTTAHHTPSDRGATR